MTTPSLITSEDGWLDLADGEQAFLIARLDSIGRDGSLLLSHADWSQVAIAVEGDASYLQAGIDRLRQEAAGRSVRILVTRDEDGIFITPEDILSVEILS